MPSMSNVLVSSRWRSKGELRVADDEVAVPSFSRLWTLSGALRRSTPCQYRPCRQLTSRLWAWMD